VNAQYIFVGKCKELNEGHFRKKIGLAVTRNKFVLNEWIRNGEDKPDDVFAQIWDTLVLLQNDPSVQAMSDFMRSIILECDFLPVTILL
jgi:hypothetical protein